ncbi:MAG: HEPN domain-containing protein [Candidatus Aenigmarchaeota archaeon]|nr:HEPN domain-containing protein [Candidatus Aenigmarchaeota archaeon]
MNKLKKEGKLELVEPSEEICKSYLEKADNCLKSAKLLLRYNLYENSISMSYYTMYNSLTSLLFKTGIKCENHAGSIVLLKKLFGRVDLFKIISFAKEERIDKQYYVTSEKNFVLTKESAEDMVAKAENFLVKMKLVIAELKNEQTEKLRKEFENIDQTQNGD